jgi:hypothetical protein
MPVLFERPGYWTCEHTEKGIFFVHMRISTVTDVNDLNAFMEEARPHLKRLAPVLYMNDATDVQEGPLTILGTLARHMKTNAQYIKKSAIFGLTPRKSFVVRSVIRASGRDNVRVFDTRDQCETWLLE